MRKCLIKGFLVVALTALFAISGISSVFASPSVPDVLLLNADNGNGEPLRTQLQAFGDLGAIDGYDARGGTPSLAYLLNYDVVITWTNYTYQDPTGIGNVLADYVDAGGRVINMVFSMGTAGWGMAGRFMNEGYTAVNGADTDYSTSCLGTYDSGHPIMFGITNVCDYYRLSGTYLTTDSTAVAYWGDGDIFVGAKNNNTVVSITGYPGPYRLWTGQMDSVLHNAIFSLVSQQPTLNVIKTGTGSGTVAGDGIDCGTDCSETYDEGTVVTLTATPSTGSIFAGWSGDCDSSGKVTVDASKTCTATFSAARDLIGSWNSVRKSGPDRRGIYTLSGSLNVSNTGTLPANNVIVNVYLSSNSTYELGDTLIASLYYGTIGAKITKVKSFAVSTRTNPRGKYVIAVIDPSNIVIESNETNNSVFRLVP